MKHCCVEDPSDLCSVNISGQEMSEVKEDDLALFDNVAYVNASENYLPFGGYKQVTDSTIVISTGINLIL
jgi:hypothetical protein